MLDLPTDEARSERSAGAFTRFDLDGFEEDPLDVETCNSDLGSPGIVSNDEPDESLSSYVSLNLNQECPRTDIRPRKRKRSASDVRRKTFPGSSSDERPSEDSNPGSVGSMITVNRCANIKTETWDNLGSLPDEDGKLNISSTVISNDLMETCHICGEVFTTKLELSKHFKSRHGRNRKSVASVLTAHFVQKHQGGPSLEPKSEVKYP